GHIRTRLVGPVQNLQLLRLGYRDIGHDDGKRGAYATSVERPDTRPGVVQSISTIEPQTDVAHTLRAEVADPVIGRGPSRRIHARIPTEQEGSQNITSAALIEVSPSGRGGRFLANERAVRDQGHG